MYIEFIEKPLHNLFLWLIGLTPGNSMFFGILLFALLTKIVISILVYHGHVANIKHHAISKHVDKIHKKYKNSKDKISDEIYKIYGHYSFHPWKGLFIVMIHSVVLFAILNFLYLEAGSGLKNLDLTIMENIFIPFSMDIYWGGIDLLKPLTAWWGVALIGVVQFISLEIYLLTKRKIHLHPLHEEIVEHIINLIIAIVIAFIATTLPAALFVYWMFFLLFGIIRKLIFDKYIDHKILIELQEIEKKIEKKEEPHVRSFDRHIVYLLWRLFNSKTPKKNFLKIQRDAKKKSYALHHFRHIHHIKRKLFEEPHVIAYVLLFLILAGFVIWK